MNPLNRFFAYAQDFELTYVDDDWTRLAQYFAPDADYRVEGSGAADTLLEGREAIFAGIRRFLDGFDRQCQREIRAVEPPTLEGNTVHLHGQAWYRRGESPAVVFDLIETAEFREGVIVHLTDRYAAPLDESMKEWMDRWGQGLSPAYD